MSAALSVYLTFDVEVWCGGWDNLDASFASSFDRYIYGRSQHGEYALPKTLETLERYGLRGTFFVEPLFAARFGQKYLDTIVGLIRSRGQEVQLHLHPEWTDEIRPALIADCARKRQHLSYYTLDEQIALIGHGRSMLQHAGCSRVDAFRAGSFASDRNTFAALAALGIRHDSSVDVCLPVSCADRVDRSALHAPFVCEGVSVHPMSVFHDGFGRLRHAQVGACSFTELKQALCAAAASGMGEFVILSHNFELLKPGSTRPDWTVVRRFARLCEYLASRTDRFVTCGLAEDRGGEASASTPAIPRVGRWATGVRMFEQALRRL